MRRLFIFSAAALIATGAGYALAQTPAAKGASTQTAPPAPAQRFTTPPLQNPGFSPSRPLDQVRALYQFAAQNPEVLGYVPCYCGCESQGHTNNDTCFVKRRDAKGNVAEWEPHGFGCAVCIDVGLEAMRMHRSGADVASIRAAIERKWTPTSQNKTPTPMPPPRKK
jgi:hypothetical protein